MVRNTIKELLKKCTELRHGRNDLELAQSLIHLALLYQEKHESNDAIGTAMEAINTIQRCNSSNTGQKLLFSSYRILAEVYAEEDNRERALRFLEQSRKAAVSSENHSHIQLSLHVSAWVFEKLWVVGGSTNRADLLQAYEFAKRSLEYLQAHGAKIDLDAEAVATYDSSDYRRAHLDRLISGIAGNLDKRVEAERHMRNAMNFARKKNLTDLRYELQIVQLDFSWVDKKKLAQILVNEAPAKRKCGAKLELSQVLIYSGDMERAFDVLLNILAENNTDLSAEDLDLLQSRIIFVYKFVKALKRSRDEKCDLKEKRRIFEQMGDWILEYSANNKETLWQAVGFYNDMLRCSFALEERIPALISLGQTYFDLKKYADALHYFEECLVCEERAKKPKEKTLSTRILIFDTKCKGDIASIDDLISCLDKLLEEIPARKAMMKAERCEIMAALLDSKNISLSKDYKQMAKQFQNNAEPDDESSDPSNTSEQIERNIIDDNEIIERCKKIAKQRNEISHFEKRKSWRNNHGETELHLEAKGDNTNRLKLLIQHGYEVNARDNSGWTPLHEATNHKKINHVKHLLIAGARVDAASNEGDDGGLDEGRIGGKITPLMDACANLTEGEEMLEIAELLYKHEPKFVILKNEDGWTAVDFLRDSIKKLEQENDIDFIPRAQKLFNQMKTQFKKEGLIYQEAPRIQRVKHKSMENRHNRKRTSTTLDGIYDYQKAMNNIGSRAKPSVDNYSTNSTIIEEGIEEPQDNFETMDYDVFGGENTPLRDLSFEDCNLPPIAISSRNMTRASNTQLDDFIIDDIGRNPRKRKSTNFTAQQPRKRDREQSIKSITTMDTNVNDFEPTLNLCSSPCATLEPKRRSAVNEEIADVPTQTGSTPHFSCSVEISFLDGNGEPLRKNILTVFESSATIKAVQERCQKSLLSHQKEFIICLEDDTEVDSEIPLSMLRNNPSNRLKFKCIVQKPSAQVLFQSYNQDIVFEREIIEKLQQFSLPGSPDELDFSLTEIDYCIQPLLRSLVDSTKRLKKVNLNFCDLGKTDAPTMCALLENCLDLSIVSCNVTDFFLKQVLQTGIVFQSLVNLNISFNPISSTGLLSFLKQCPSLSDLSIKGLNLQVRSNDVAQVLCGLSSLTNLAMSNTCLSSSALEYIFSSCSQIVNLDIGSTEISFSFSQCWLPALRNLRMSGCIVQSWESFIDWISMGSVEYIDLSCTSVSVNHIISLCERRIDSSLLTLRLLRCPRVEHRIEYLKDTILLFLQTNVCPLRLQLPANITRMIKLETALSSEFLTD